MSIKETYYSTAEKFIQAWGGKRESMKARKELSTLADEYYEQLKRLGADDGGIRKRHFPEVRGLIVEMAISNGWMEYSEDKNLRKLYPVCLFSVPESVMESVKAADKATSKGGRSPFVIRGEFFDWIEAIGEIILSSEITQPYEAWRALILAEILTGRRLAELAFKSDFYLFDGRFYQVARLAKMKSEQATELSGGKAYCLLFDADKVFNKVIEARDWLRVDPTGRSRNPRGRGDSSRNWEEWKTQTRTLLSIDEYNTCRNSAKRQIDKAWNEIYNPDGDGKYIDEAIREETEVKSHLGRGLYFKIMSIAHENLSPDSVSGDDEFVASIYLMEESSAINNYKRYKMRDVNVTKLVDASDIFWEVGYYHQYAGKRK